MKTPVEETVWSALSELRDPEIPVLTLVEMKIIREVRVDGGTVHVVISPTFVGCPALEQMKSEIRDRLGALGIGNVDIEVTFSPPWSTDLLGEETREKLRIYGVAPPPQLQADLPATLSLPVACPFCGATNTRMQSPFGATLCKQMYVCGNCREPFERFKPV